MNRVCECCGLLRPQSYAGLCDTCRARRDYHGATTTDMRRCGRCGKQVYGSYWYVWGTVLCDRCVEEANCVATTRISAG